MTENSYYLIEKYVSDPRLVLHVLVHVLNRHAKVLGEEVLSYSGSLIQAPDLRDDMYFDALNSLLVSGEYPPLFSVDELDSLLQVISD